MFVEGDAAGEVRLGGQWRAGASNGKTRQAWIVQARRVVDLVRSGGAGVERHGRRGAVWHRQARRGKAGMEILMGRFDGRVTSTSLRGNRQPTRPITSAPQDTAGKAFLGMALTVSDRRSGAGDVGFGCCGRARICPSRFGDAGTVTKLKEIGNAN